MEKRKIEKSCNEKEKIQSMFYALSATHTVQYDSITLCKIDENGFKRANILSFNKMVEIQQGMKRTEPPEQDRLPKNNKIRHL